MKLVQPNDDGVLVFYVLHTEVDSQADSGVLRPQAQAPIILQARQICYTVQKNIQFSV